MDPDRVRTRLRLRVLDARDRLRGSRVALVPPRHLEPGRHADFAAEGQARADALVARAQLRSDSRVLDVGCGHGALARPLTRVLGPGGRYLGFDGDRAAVGWCRRAYRGHPGFQFLVADVRDARRNPGAARREDDFRFPCADASVDVVSMSLTGLLPEACAHHLGEAARVLAPDGSLAARFFALNDTSRALMAAGHAGLVFDGAEEGVALLDDELPDEAVAHAEDWIFERLRDQGLVLTQMHPGSWCGREEFVGFEDLVVAVRDA